MKRLSRGEQFRRNADLSADAMTYLSEHPSLIGSIPSDASIVVYSENDNKLNKANDELIMSLSNSGKSVVKAEKDKKTKKWRFYLYVG